MFFRKTRSGKSDVTGPLISDLDSLLVTPVYFRFQGREHKIPPITTEMFMRWTEEYSKFIQLKDKEHLTPDELLSGYWSAIRTICPSVTMNDLRDASQAQIAGLLQLVVDAITGRAHAEAEGKKKLPMSESSSSQSVAPSS